MKLTTTEFETLRTERERDVAWAAFDIRRTNSVLRLVRNGTDERIVESRSDEEIPQIELDIDPWMQPSIRKHEPMFAKSPIASLAVAITLVIAAAALVILVALPFVGG